MSDIGTYERLLAEWREAEATAEALRQFRENGGDYRLRMKTDNGDPVIAGIMDRLMRGRGYVVFLDKAIALATNEAEKARKSLIDAATKEQEFPIPTQLFPSFIAGGE